MHAKIKEMKRLLGKKLWTLPFILTFLLGCTVNVAVTVAGFAITGAIYVVSTAGSYLIASFIKGLAGKNG